MASVPRRCGGGRRHAHVDHVREHHEQCDADEQSRDSGERERAQWALLEVTEDPRAGKGAAQAH